MSDSKSIQKAEIEHLTFESLFLIEKEFHIEPIRITPFCGSFAALFVHLNFLSEEHT